MLRCGSAARLTAFALAGRVSGFGVAALRWASRRSLCERLSASVALGLIKRRDHRRGPVGVALLAPGRVVTMRVSLAAVAGLLCVQARTTEIGLVCLNMTQFGLV